RLGRLIMKKALYLAFSDRSIMNRIASNADFSSLRSRNLPSRVYSLFPIPYSLLSIPYSLFPLSTRKLILSTY
ncbi:MAG: hypothetical protein AB4206_21650, partial [Xenococcaceae cyanobacterium]